MIQREEKSGARISVQCPTSIIDYNKYMGGVDRADQRKESYALDRKSKRSWLRIFFNFLNITLSNAFILLKKHTDSSMTHLNFLSSFIQCWLKKEWLKDECLLQKIPVGRETDYHEEKCHPINETKRDYIFQLLAGEEDVRSAVPGKHEHIDLFIIVLIARSILYELELKLSLCLS